MTYEKLIETISEIIDNEKIEKNGLNLVYSLYEEDYLSINKFLYFKYGGSPDDYEETDEFEVTIAGILVKFLKIK
jgi:hypothetical protein